MIRKVISGGQAGVDRAALDFFMQRNIACGGWCPKGRIAEDGFIPKKYPLKETTETLPIFRTKKNVEEADGTLILFINRMDEGTLQTKDYVQKLDLPLYIQELTKDFSLDEFTNWINTKKIGILNIAGTRESNNPGIYKRTLFFLENLKDLF